MNDINDILLFDEFKNLVYASYPNLDGKMTSNKDLQFYLDSEFPNLGEVIIKTDTITKPISIIGVLDPSLPSTHWVILLDYNVYIDSFGLVPPLNVVNQVNIEYVNVHKFQYFNSSLCGMYCLYMLYVYKNNPALLNDVINRM
jgi:hypothetical protein